MLTNGSAKCQEMGDAQLKESLRLTAGQRMTGKPFVQGMGRENPSGTTAHTNINFFLRSVSSGSVSSSRDEIW